MEKRKNIQKEIVAWGLVVVAVVLEAYAAFVWFAADLDKTIVSAIFR